MVNHEGCPNARPCGGVDHRLHLPRVDPHRRPRYPDGVLDTLLGCRRHGSLERIAQPAEPRQPRHLRGNSGRILRSHLARFHGLDRRRPPGPAVKDPTRSYHPHGSRTRSCRRFDNQRHRRDQAHRDSSPLFHAKPASADVLRQGLAGDDRKLGSARSDIPASPAKSLRIFW